MRILAFLLIIGLFVTMITAHSQRHSTPRSSRSARNSLKYNGEEIDFFNHPDFSFGNSHFYSHNDQLADDLFFDDIALHANDTQPSNSSLQSNATLSSNKTTTTNNETVANTLKPVVKSVVKPVMKPVVKSVVKSVVRHSKAASIKKLDSLLDDISLNEEESFIQASKTIQARKASRKVSPLSSRRRMLEQAPTKVGRKRTAGSSSLLEAFFRHHRN